MTENRFRKVQGFMYDKEGNNDKLLDLTEMEDILNKLDKENKQLKKIIDFADWLIDDLGHEEMKRQWEEFDD